MIDLHSDIRDIERYAKQYEHYIPFTNARTQHRMQYDYIAHPLVEEPTQTASSKWYDTPDQVKPLDICRDKAIGALVGLAVGDAVGTTLEFMPRDHRTVTDMVGGGPFRLNPESGLMTPRWLCVWLKQCWSANMPAGNLSGTNW
jgi:hypothetical protein